MADPEAVIAEFIAFADSGGEHAEPDDLERYVAGWLLEHLAAAGYTVTRDRYEPVTDRGDELWLHTGSHRPRYLPAGAPTQRNTVRLYRKIEGSTDGDDREADRD